MHIQGKVAYMYITKERANSAFQGSKASCVSGGLGVLDGFSIPKVPERVDCIGLEQVEREWINKWLEV